MDIGIFELNDAGLRLSLGDRHSETNPGYAAIDGDNLILGTLAMRRARLNPVQTNNQFWHRLSAEPLPIHNSRYRHHADLAYSQLLSVHNQLSDCEKVVFALPGNFTREQMSLLLGIVDQCPFDAVGLIDSAVAASALDANAEYCLHVDIQLHQCVFTLIKLDGTLTRQQIEVLPSAGLLALFDRFAKSVADQFVDQSRFDPLHSAVGEQSIYDQLPGWLAQSFEQTDMIVEVEGKTAKISRNQLIAPLNNHFQQISDLALKLLGTRGQILVGNHLANLPGFMQVLTQAGEGKLIDAPTALDENAVVRGIQQNFKAIVKTEGDLSFVQSLPTSFTVQSAPTTATNTFSTTSTTNASADEPNTSASHVLVDSRAYALGTTPLFVNANSKIYVSSHASGETVGILQCLSDAVSLLPQGKTTLYRNQQALTDNTVINSGDCIRAQNVDGQLHFIEVLNHGP